jgi:heme-degrading monooxygenase HmoA
MEFVSRSEITVPVAEMPALERAFRERARHVDSHSGFVGLELLRDIRDNGRYVLVTRWASRADFTAYMKSGDHARAHERPHEGLGPVGNSARPGAAKLEQFHVVLEERARE